MVAGRRGGMRLLGSLLIIACLESGAGTNSSNSSDATPLCAILAEHWSERSPAGCGNASTGSGQACRAGAAVSACVNSCSGCAGTWSEQPGLAGVGDCAAAAQGCELRVCLSGESGCQNASLAVRMHSLSADSTSAGYWGGCSMSNVSRGDNSTSLVPVGDAVCARLARGAAAANAPVTAAQCGVLSVGVGHVCARGIMVGCAGCGGNATAQTYHVRQVCIPT